MASRPHRTLPPMTRRWSTISWPSRRPPRWGEPGYVAPVEVTAHPWPRTTVVILLALALLVVSLAGISYTSRVSTVEGSCRHAYDLSQAKRHDVPYGVYRKTFC